MNFTKDLFHLAFISTVITACVAMTIFSLFIVSCGKRPESFTVACSGVSMKVTLTDQAKVSVEDAKRLLQADCERIQSAK
jgi:hypothetical protein